MLYECRRCGRRAYRTYEVIDERSKSNAWGHYGRQHVPERVNSTVRRQMDFFERIHDGMWFRDYEMGIKDCKDWSREFFNKAT